MNPTTPEGAAESSSAKTSAGLFSIAAAFALSRGMTTSEIENVTGLSSVALSNPNARLPEESLHQLMRALGEREPNSAFPLELAEGAPYDNLSQSLRHAATVREVLQFFSQHRQTVSDRVLVQLKEEGSIATFTLAHPLDAVDQGRMAIFSLAYLWRILQEILSKPLQLQRVESPFSAAGSPAIYERYFGCPVIFESRQNAMIFDRQTLDQPIRYANAELFAFSREYHRHVLESLGHSTEPTEYDQLRIAISQNAHTGIFDSDSAASAANMSLRKAQRIAAAHQTCVKDLIVEVRSSLAKNMVSNPNLPVEDIAEFLGYANESAFRRAFKDWTGKTPTAFRAATTKSTS
ncbi:MAG: AraC family transcriptional regulator ligand-binding domain-containing protein [Verrucomicrobiota bacterium]